MDGDWLNYHHLFYFYLTAAEGSVTAAAHRLGLSHPTISKQIRQLETNLGRSLFRKVGRGLELTDEGRTVFGYAERIFATGRELERHIRGYSGDETQYFTVGMPDVLPKLITHRLLMPALTMTPPMHLVAYEGKLDDLIYDLSAHRLDMIISDSPLSPTVNIAGHIHHLGGSNVAFFGTHELCEAAETSFPDSLSEVPVLLPVKRTAVRRNLDQFFFEHGIAPRIVAEFEDTALMKVFGQSGTGLFPAPLAMTDQIREQYGLYRVGNLPTVREEFYAITAERETEHPATSVIVQAARERLAT